MPTTPIKLLRSSATLEDPQQTIVHAIGTNPVPQVWPESRCFAWKATVSPAELFATEVRPRGP